MRSYIFRQVLPTLWAQVCPNPENISAEFQHPEFKTAGQAFGHDVIRTINERQGTFFPGQTLRSRTVQMGQVAFGRLDNVSDQDWPKALRTAQPHGAPLSRDANGVTRSLSGKGAAGRIPRQAPELTNPAHCWQAGTSHR